MSWFTKLFKREDRTVERYGHSEWIRAEYAISKDKIKIQSKAEQPCHPEE